MKLQTEQEMTQIQPSTFLSLKEYPNNVLLSRSKRHLFHNNTTMFESRCILFTQLCYINLKTQAENKNLLISKNLFLNHHKCLFMFFTYDTKFKDRFRVVESGKILQNIMDYYQFMFPADLDKQYDEFDDCEQVGLIESSKQLMRKISNLGSFQADRLTYVKVVKDLLQSSQLFQEFSYQLKWNMAVLIKAITWNQGERQEILQTYYELLDIQKNISRLMRFNQHHQGLGDLYNQYYKNLFYFFKLLQAHNYLKITSIQEQSSLKIKPQKSPSIIIFTIDFSSNPKRNQFINKTLRENSSQQSAANMDQEEKDNIPNKKKEYIQTLYISKNSIRFKIKIQFLSKANSLGIEVEGQSHWTLEEFYYDLFYNLWSQFINLWYNNILENNSGLNGKEHRQFKWQLVQRQNCPAIKQKFQLQPSANITSETLISVDRIVMLLLLYENTLKYLFKVSQTMIDYDENYLNHLQDKSFIDNLVVRFNHSIREYERYENILQEIDIAFLHK